MEKASESRTNGRGAGDEGEEVVVDEAVLAMVDARKKIRYKGDFPIFLKYDWAYDIVELLGGCCDPYVGE